MKQSTPNDNKPRLYKERGTQTDATDDNWLVTALALGLRLLWFLCVASARAVIIVAGNNLPDNPLNQSLHNDPPHPVHSSAQHTDKMLDVSEKDLTTATQTYYVVFVGREVGYTTSSSLMTSLVQGIPNNASRKFNTIEEAFRAYTESVARNNVRRVRTVVNPSGHVEFIYEDISFAAGIRNLDTPHLPPQSLAPVNGTDKTPAPTPCFSEEKAVSCDEATGSSVSSASSTSDSNGVAPPADLPLVDARETSADTVIISAAEEPLAAAGTLTVLFLDSDEDSSNASVLVNNSISTHSAHSSDVYYVDKQYDIAFAAYIEEEEVNIACKETNGAVLVD